jgi:hypothetical protein
VCVDDTAVSRVVTRDWITRSTVGAPSATILGLMPISAGQTAFDVEYSFATVSGASFRLEYITNASVSAGCGGSDYSNTGSKVTLSNQ